MMNILFDEGVEDEALEENTFSLLRGWITEENFFLISLEIPNLLTILLRKGVFARNIIRFLENYQQLFFIWLF